MPRTILATRAFARLGRRKGAGGVGEGVSVAKKTPARGSAVLPGKLPSSLGSIGASPMTMLSIARLRTSVFSKKSKHDQWEANWNEFRCWSRRCNQRCR